MIPGAVGAGIDTPAGRGGKIYRVTTLADSGAGSLRECVEAGEPRVCVFEVSGSIRVNTDLTVRHPRLTIAGQTAPSPGIMIHGAGLKIMASDVLVQHIRVRPGDHLDGPDPRNRDALRIVWEGPEPIRNIVIDHSSFGWSVGKNASLWGNWRDVSLLNNIFAEPLHDSTHPKGPHGYGVLLGPADTTATMVGNLLTHSVTRNPLSNVTHLVYVNNVIYNWMNMAVDLQGQQSKPTYNSIVGNVFVRGPDYRANKPVSLRAGNHRLPSGSKVFLHDNLAPESGAPESGAPESGSDPWSIAAPIQGSLNTENFRGEDPRAWHAGLTALPTSKDVVLNRVLATAGARPADRDSVDRRAVEQVRNRSGHVVNCVAPDGTERCKKNAGGWPQLAENRRTLELPANPHAVTSSGYTNLELWLHELAAEVEGRRADPPAAPVLTATE